MRVDKVPRWLPAGGGYLHSGLSLGPVQTGPGLAEQGGRAPVGQDPTAMSTSCTGASASGRPERTPAECPYQHACERGAGSCLTPGLELKPLRNWSRKISPFH